MKMSFDVTAKKLFGVRYERLARTLFLRLRLLCPARAPQEEGQSPPPRLCLALPVPLLDGPQELSGQHGSDVGVARVLPVLLGQMEARFVLPIDFAVLFLNTPPCILLSCSCWPVWRACAEKTAGDRWGSSGASVVLCGIRCWVPRQRSAS